MNELIAIQKIAGWEKLKTLVLDFLADYHRGVVNGLFCSSQQSDGTPNTHWP